MDDDSEFDPIDKFYSKWSRYSTYICALLFTSQIPLSWHYLTSIFLDHPLNFTCGDSEELNKCPCSVGDTKWNRTIFAETVQCNFHLNCERYWISLLSQIMFYLGLLVGGFLYGSLADRFGRRNSFSSSVLLLCVSGTTAAFMPEIASFIIMRTVEGVAAGGYMVVNYVLLIEQVGVHHREIVTALWHVFFNIGHLTLPGIAYYLRNFKHLLLAISVPLLPMLSYQFIIYPSPKYLFARGRIDDASNILEKINRFNGDSVGDIRAQLEEASRAQERPTKANLGDVFKNKELLKRLINMSINYFSCGFGYYGVSVFISSMEGDIFFNVAMSGLILIPVSLSTILLLKYLGRKVVLFAMDLIGAIIFLLLFFLPSHLYQVRIALAIIGNASFFACFLISFLFAVELFPTTVRNAALGFLAMISRMGMILSPPINLLPNMYMFLVYGFVPLLAAFCAMFLPETKGHSLQSHIS